MITDYDILVLSSLNSIQNGDEVKPKELTSWIVTKKLSKSKKGNDLENSSVLSSLKKMNKLGLVNLEIEENENKIKKIWTINCKNVFFEYLKFPEGRKKSIRCWIDEKWLIREI
ncbi:MAG: hypothetical protein KKF48_02405 [Nanoarchaeota archaeon]|nr:hypothetical protein [Nanoarchaeota archaeon]MBU1027872.1 hypothetical protein [Nanoarchaeota archaeon]